ncbi:rhodanese-like domain-containing protein [Aliiroseovarius crassostreae]|uniref:rhodanese-like domain-containing protein n=1 Tax=Aliiroseovarius crassostreae TaxID=154981 RepID=UPI0022078CC8|nr:rhodanese-like domain-containing protein [Aliiroseovarius crassostreae]UWP89716.1 rhodanese-like domain-containing protein [Aliiroseovarius crassostreae]
MRKIFFAAAVSALASSVIAGPVLAGEVNIRPDIASVTVPTTSGDVVIERVQDTANELSGEWARTSRACPNFCVQPMYPAPGVTPVGELEMLEFLQDPEVIVVDSRVADHHATGTIPGAISIPYNEAADRLDELGCEVDFDGFDCEGAKPVALFCNGNWCGQSPTAIRRMIEAGYPAERIHYYRGGMHAWRMLGLTVTGG